MIRMNVLVNDIQECVITIANMTESGIDPDGLNEYSIWMNGENTKKTVLHWRKEGLLVLCHLALQEVYNLSLPVKEAV